MQRETTSTATMLVVGGFVASPLTLYWPVPCSIHRGAAAVHGFSRSASIGRDESLPGMPVRARAMYNLLELLEV